MSNPNTVIAVGSLLAFIGVLAGAFGAHALKNTLDAYYMDVFKTAVQYQMMHALGMVLIGILMQTMNAAALSWAAGLMLAGVILFSGSLYLLTLSGTKWLGMVTPIGGLCFMAGWLMLMFAALR